MDEALGAAVEVVRGYGIDDDPVLLQDSNHVIVAIGPVVAKVAGGHRRARLGSLERELAVASFLAEAGAPVVPPWDDAVHRVGAHLVTLWRRVERPGEPSVAAAAAALRHVHDVLLGYEGELPAYTEALAEAASLLADRDALPGLGARDREFLLGVHDEIAAALPAPGGGRPLRGEAHLGNALATADGVLWLDFELACRGPLEWDLAFFPEPALAADRFDPDLLAELRRAVSLTVAVWCFARSDHPELAPHAAYHLAALKQARA